MNKLYIGNGSIDGYECYQTMKEIDELPRSSYEEVYIENVIGHQGDIAEALHLAYSKLAPEGMIKIYDVETSQVLTDMLYGYIDLKYGKKLLDDGSMIKLSDIIDIILANPAFKINKLKLNVHTFALTLIK